MISTAENKSYLNSFKGYREWLNFLITSSGNIRPNWECFNSVKAYINHSRWLADCPFCNNSYDVSLKDTVFYCHECNMEGNENLPMRVIFPEDRIEIEEVLNSRVKEANRNWYPNETVQQLIGETNGLDNT